MDAVVDSSCYVAIALAEPGTDAVRDRLAGCVRLWAAPLLEAELAATLRREDVLVDRPSLLEGLTWLLPDRALAAEIDRVLEQGALRGADAWHLAHALWLAPDARGPAFLTLDERQRQVALKLGFQAPGLLGES